MRTVLKLWFAVQVVGLAFLTASAQLPNCPLRPNSGTAPRRFKRFRTRAHMRTLFDCTSPHESSFANGGAELKLR